MRRFEIWWSDLTPSAKKRLKPLYDDAIEVSPLSTIELDDDDDMGIDFDGDNDDSQTDGVWF